MSLPPPPLGGAPLTPDPYSPNSGYTGYGQPPPAQPPMGAPPPVGGYTDPSGGYSPLGGYTDPNVPYGQPPAAPYGQAPPPTQGYGQAPPPTQGYAQPQGYGQQPAASPPLGAPAAPLGAGGYPPAQPPISCQPNQWQQQQGLPPPPVPPPMGVDPNQQQRYYQDPNQQYGQQQGYQQPPAQPPQAYGAPPPLGSTGGYDWSQYQTCQYTGQQATYMQQAPPAYTADYTQYATTALTPQQTQQYTQAPSGWQQAPTVWKQGDQAPQLSGRKKALLIGINYIGTRLALRGCINDVHTMKNFLLNKYGFHDNGTEMVTLTDDQQSPQFRPTRENIIKAMTWLVSEVKQGDCLFFHFSGHGAQLPDPTGQEADGMDETIIPVDFQGTTGHITDTEIHNIMIRPLPSGVRLTAVMDCCHSGTGMDLPFFWSLQQNQWDVEENPCFSMGDVQLFSGCEDDQTSADASNTGFGGAGGAMTTGFCTVLSQTQNPTYPQLMAALHQNLQQRGFKQKPTLSATQKFSFNRTFSLLDVVPNTNQYLGQVQTTKKKKNKKKNKKAKNTGGGANPQTNPFLQMLMGMGGPQQGGAQNNPMGAIMAGLGNFFK